jgi:hypothetical protein
MVFGQIALYFVPRRYSRTRRQTNGTARIKASIRIRLIRICFAERPTLPTSSPKGFGLGTLPGIGSPKPKEAEAYSPMGPGQVAYGSSPLSAPGTRARRGRGRRSARALRGSSPSFFLAYTSLRARGPRRRPPRLCGHEPDPATVAGLRTPVVSRAPPLTIALRTVDEEAMPGLGNEHGRHDNRLAPGRGSDIRRALGASGASRLLERGRDRVLVVLPSTGGGGHAR